MFLRLGEVRMGGGRLSDVFRCFSNSVSGYTASTTNTSVQENEDEDVRRERELVSELWADRSSHKVCRPL